MEPWIPKCMIVGGSATLSFYLVIISMIVCGILESKKGISCGMVLAILLVLFIFAWNIASSYWVFKEWSNWDNVKDKPEIGCHKETYLFIFSMLIITWVTSPCQGSSSQFAVGVTVDV